MTHTPPVPAANQSPYPLREPPHPPTPPLPPVAKRAPQAGGQAPWLALAGAGLIAIVGGVLLARRR